MHVCLREQALGGRRVGHNAAHIKMERGIERTRAKMGDCRVGKGFHEQISSLRSSQLLKPPGKSAKESAHPALEHAQEAGDAACLALPSRTTRGSAPLCIVSACGMLL